MTIMAGIGNQRYTASLGHPLSHSTSSHDSYVIEAFRFDLSKFNGQSPSVISSDFNYNYGVRADIEPLLKKITFKGSESKVKRAIDELKTIDVLACPYYSGATSTSITPRTCYSGTASTPTTSSSSHDYSSTAPILTTPSTSFSRNTFSSQTTYPPKKLFFGDDVAKILYFCDLKLKANKSIGLIKVDLFCENQPPCLRLTCLSYENLFCDCCKEIEQKIKTLHKRQVLGIPYHKQEQAKKITGQINKENHNDCLVICKPEQSMIELYGERSHSISEIQMKIETELGLKRSDSATTSILSQTPPVTVNSYQNFENSVVKTNETVVPKSSGLNASRFYSKFLTREGLKVKIYCCSITDLKVDAIVNAANENLQHVGGVARAIAEAAGPKLGLECSRKLTLGKGFVDVTKNMVTSGYKLQCSKVIHAVGPQWNMYSDKTKCLEDLYRTVKNALLAAENNAVAIVGMPVISSGIFGVPQDLCAEVYVHSIMEFSRQSQFQFLKEIHIVDINDIILKKICLAYQKWKKDAKSVDPIYAATNHPTLMKSTRTFSRIQDSDVDMQSEHSVHESVVPQKDKSKSFRENRTHVIKILEIQDSTIPKTQIVVKNFQVGGLLEIKIYTGSIVRVSGIDAIVCSADKNFSGSGLLSQFIADAGGSRYKENFRKLQSIHRFPNIGDVYSCKAGNIKVNYVVHVVMDQLAGVDGRYLRTYKQNITAMLEKTSAWKMKEIAIPLIGAGFIEKDQRDLGLCCKAFLEAICDFCHQKGQMCGLEKIHLVNKNTSITDALVKTFKSNASKLSVRAKSAAIPRAKTENDDSSHSLDDISLTFHGNKRHNSESDKWKGARPKQPHRSFSTADNEDTEEFQSTVTTNASNEKLKDVDCVICMDKIKNGKKLKCGHEFCQDCISDAFKHKPACPMCGSIFGKVFGNQPDDGEMKVHTDNFPSLPGFEGCGTIVIKYIFPDGIQRENHPNPGKKYKGTERTAYLPDNTEGRKILRMLRVAWNRKLIFTIGSSHTTGQENVVTWNDIHHKTKRFPGAEFGFPDAGYFDRVTDELAAKGVTENDI
ncbi:hypothetical protein KUTeg_005257 [Tegillarca granosa]|uniref:RING-type E3 ubiquitin transferase n=1 Tax=Tegillarca granosa TaxID=220873 RepID=A0ABQ9FNR8_TEGGR|nr:hypothetical protein KUTeg_005257 [Tegillarca granosa]